MFLYHNIFGNKKTLIKILESKYLLPSSITKNVNMFGHKTGSPYIFMMINNSNTKTNNNKIADLKFNPSLLLDNNFYLNIGWKAKPESHKDIIIGSKLTLPKLKELLKSFINNVNIYLKTLENKDMFKHTSHEILITNKIDLSKYLIEINVNTNNYTITQISKILKLCKLYYPNVIVNMYNI